MKIMAFKQDEHFISGIGGILELNVTDVKTVLIDTKKMEIKIYSPKFNKYPGRCITEKLYQDLEYKISG